MTRNTVHMKDASSAEDEAISPPPEPDAHSEARRKRRLEQKEKMRKWMEEEEEDGEEASVDPMQDVKASVPDPGSKLKAESDAMIKPEPESDAEDAVEDAVEDVDQPSAPIDGPKLKTSESQEEEDEDEEPPTTVSGGRRRGRRKVMKKKMTRDAEGYLVTKEEPVWESFSEDEAPAPVSSGKTKITSSAAAGVKAKKAAGKPGQGNIMNFFGKK